VDHDQGIATIGITHHAQEQLGDVVHIEMNVSAGEAVKEKQSFAAVESVKAVSDVYTVLSGSVWKLNEALLEAPQGLNEAPFEHWLIKIQTQDQSQWKAAMDSALSRDVYLKWLAE